MQNGLKVHSIIPLKNCSSDIVIFETGCHEIPQLIILGYFLVFNNLESYRNLLNSLNSDEEIRDVLNLCLNIDLEHMYYKSSYS